MGRDTDNAVKEVKSEESKSKVWLSFIVPVYNGEKYLRDCLDSLLCQNVKKEEYEIICINDGSKDNSSHILDEYANKYQNVKVIHKENEGVSTARNIGIDLAKGQYIWCVDCDDFICNGCLSSIIKVLKQENQNLIRIAHKEVSENSNWLDTNSSELKINKNSNKVRTLAAWKFIISKTFIKEKGIMFVSGIARGEDGLFCDEIYINLEQESILEIENIIYFYRQNATSVCHQKNIESANNVILDHIKRMEIYKNKLEVQTSNKKKRKAIRETRSFVLSKLLFALPCTALSKKEVFKILKEKRLFIFDIVKPGDKLGWYLKKKEAILSNIIKMPLVYTIYFKIKRKRFNKRNKQ